MAIFDKFLSAIRLNDDYDEDDEDFYDDEEDDFEDEEDFEEPKPKKSSRFTSRMSHKNEPAREMPKADHEEKATAGYRQVKPVKSTSKITPIKRKSAASGQMEVCVIKPTKVEDYREIADTLLAGCTVILNLEGLDVELAQRIIDFSSGSCYAINGSLQKVSSYIFTLTPDGVEISGDIQDILGTASNNTTMRNSF
ncbi:MAG: cell division protein SepF [Eubacterium sp.]|nr:cell division protein SepF [Eubacterium sp.]